VDPVGFDVHGVLPHELQDVLDAGGVGQAAEADAVAGAARRGKVGRRGEDGHHGRRGQRGDQGCGHVAVQDLEEEDEESKVITAAGSIESFTDMFCMCKVDPTF